MHQKLRLFGGAFRIIEDFNPLYYRDKICVAEKWSVLLTKTDSQDELSSW